MSDDSDDRTFFWLWTWIFVAVSSAGYAVVNLIGSTPATAAGTSGTIRFLIGVALPIGMSALAAWFAVAEWRSGPDPS
jgi:hypothetical protein